MLIRVCDAEAYYPENGVGIGNRIKNLISILRATNAKKLHIHWTDSGWVNAKFSDLFLFDGIEITEDNLKNIHNSPDFYRFLGPNLISESNYEQCYVQNRPADHIYDDDIPKKELFLPYFKILKPAQKVQDRMKDFLYSGEYIALQVRNAPDWDAYFSNIDLSKFFAAIEAYSKTTKFYLSCMSNEVAKIFKERYGGQILDLPDKDYSSMIDAVSDLFIMSKAKEMIVSYGSTFSEIAYWIGGAEAKVKVIGCYQDWINDSANAVKSHKQLALNPDSKLFCMYPAPAGNIEKALRYIFSVHNEYIENKKYKVISILNLKLKIKKSG